jgi:hypothetical protein
MTDINMNMIKTSELSAIIISLIYENKLFTDFFVLIHSKNRLNILLTILY